MFYLVSPYMSMTGTKNTKIQWAPLNGITLGPGQTDPINRMIPLTDMHLGINSKQALDIFKK
jgi:hypothetical protein